MINNIYAPGTGVEKIADSIGSVPKESAQGLSETFGKILTEASRNLEAADDAITQSSTGGPVDLHEVMISMEKADISLRMLVQVRNKAIDAYQEIMRMQV